MKLNKSKSKTKGKVHPSPSSSSSTCSSSSSSNDPTSSLNLLLPATILTLISTLSIQDREVLSYMITHSNQTLQNITQNHNNKKPKSKNHHKSPSFDCNCFDCYRAYWFRWDSSPSRELIHQAIEAFEEHLALSEQQKKSTPKARKSKEKEKVITSSSNSSYVGVEDLPEIPPESIEPPVECLKCEEKNFAGEETTAVVKDKIRQQQEHKGLARKVLPDVIGLFNSRLWNLWGPNV